MSRGWDALVLCAEEYQPAARSFPGTRVVHAPFRDAEDVTPDELKTAVGAAADAAGELVRGGRVLVTCWAGRNRSGLVTALALSFASGMDPARCGELVREKRGPIALTNPSFVDALNRARRAPKCDLCVGNRVTPRFYEDHLCWIALCKSCGVPMVVLRRHSTKPSREERAFMVNTLSRVAGALAPGQAFMFTEDMDTIPDHWHMHARPA